jgi:F0F1-type ATP synthase membrane subunit c/vacuolar-type H+-ATPase subunit K
VEGIVKQPVADNHATPTHNGSAEQVEMACRQATVIAAAIVASLGMYTFVVEMVMRSGTDAAPPAFFATLRIALFVVSGIAIFTSTIVKGLMLRNAPADTAGRLARLRTASVISMAFAEVPAVSGLVLVLLGRVRTDFYMLLVISLYMMVRHFPRRGGWEEYVRRGSTGLAR